MYSDTESSYSLRSGLPGRGGDQAPRWKSESQVWRGILLYGPCYDAFQAF